MSRITSGVNVSTGSTTVSLALTVAASNGVLVAMTESESSQSTGVTWNGTALTRIQTEQTDGSTRNLGLWYLLNPAIGSFNLVATKGDANARFSVIGALYGGLLQTAPAASTTGTGTGTTATGTLTSAANGSVGLFAIYNLETAGTNSTVVQFTAPLDGALFDYVPAPAGSISMTTTGSSQPYKFIMAVFSPNPSSNFFEFM